ncbi:MAG: serine--tRNA ligase, partial [Candidatus Diapherotrites archaeon]|nr:serine--tRNA ligase [Candidatus Diapherotrites archaeon]
ELKQQADDLRSKRNSISKEVEELMRAKKDAKAKIAEAKEIPERIKQIEKKVQELDEQRISLLMGTPNTLHESVPFGKDDSENKVIREFGKFEKKPQLKHHGQFAVELGGADFERAVKISGEGFYFLKGKIAILDLALQRYAVDVLTERGFTLVTPPHMIKRKPYSGVTDLSEFETVMYKIEGEDNYLIATSEHPLVSMYMDEILPEEEMPIKMCGLSACFRKEIGKHGLDERGLFRVHQFHKVEQVIFCKPEDSWKYFEELIENTEFFWKSLEIPYHVVNVCTGDIGIVAAKKYDLECWSPREGKFIELASCSNCTSYQAVRSNIKLRRKNGDKEYLHTLNNTMVPTARALRILLENCQTPEGTLKIPKALQPYMNGLKEITPVKK